MSTLNPTKKISRRQELRQDKMITLTAKIWELYGSNQMLVWGIGAGIIVVLVLVGVFAFMQSQKQSEALDEMVWAVRTFEAGNYREALDGNGASLGLIAFIDEYGGTDAGNLANFYAGDALYRLGDNETALGYFEAYDKSANLIGASALAGEATIHEALGNHDRAGDLFREAALLFESDITSPEYLLSAGRAYEKAGAYDDARDAYERIQEQFPDSNQARTIDTYIARVAVLEGAGA